MQHQKNCEEKGGKPVLCLIGKLMTA